MTKKAVNPNYWLFQATPKILRMRDALRRGALETFPVKQHRKKIKAGDKVILWQKGKEAGCYGLATVLEGLTEMPVPESEQAFYQTETDAPQWRIPISIDYNLWNKPITLELLPDNSVFQNFNAGLSGTNYKATADQFNLLLKTIQELDLALEPEPEYNLPAPLFPPLNLILFGPPGTGKTYLTTNHALSIIEKRSLSELALEDRKALRQRFEEYMNSGQIAFVSFHQAFSYEDFIEGIKPVSKEGKLEYRIEDGIFKSICTDARRCFLEALISVEPLEQEKIAFHQLYKQFLNYLNSDAFQYFKTPDDKNVFLQRVLRFGDLSVRKAQSFAVQTVQKSRLQKLYHQLLDSEQKQMSEPEVRQLLGGGNPYVYWAVLSELQVFEEQYLSKQTKTELNVPPPETLLQYGLPLATEEVLSKCRRYVLIIDEINRGNIANIFGELITLLEPDKRAGMMEALTTTLPYSKQTFSVPPNLYIVGAMNSTDRSIAQMDMALRRRFVFKELLPDPKQVGILGQPMAAGINLEALLSAINLRISLLLGKDYQIGHAYFLNIYTLDDIKDLFNWQLLPLLQEYFYDDLGKVGLVLGRDFVEELPVDTKDVFADFPHTAFDNSPRQQLYRLRPIEELDESAFIHIYDETYRHGR